MMYGNMNKTVNGLVVQIFICKTEDRSSGEVLFGYSFCNFMVFVCTGYVRRQASRRAIDTLTSLYALQLSVHCPARLEPSSPICQTLK